MGGEEVGEVDCWFGDVGLRVVYLFDLCDFFIGLFGCGGDRVGL